mmetsp:Transcript_21442/g.35903  ORF Transcript_21442/g.35903 Transcript_21442/m.35903 type:complete len:282 (-) Transcript_21442:285-1130(-)
MHDEHLLVQRGAQRQAAEHLREQLHHGVCVLVLHLALEAVDLVHVPRLVVAARHVDGCGAPHFDGEQGEDDFDTEGAAVHKVAVEQVGVVLGGHAVQLKDVHKVVVLPMDVTAHREVLVLRDSDVHESGGCLQNVFHLQQDLKRIPLVNVLLLLELLHHAFDEVKRHVSLVNPPEPWARVALLHHELAQVEGLRGRDARGVRRANGLCESDLLNLRLALFQLLLRVGVARPQPRHLTEILQPLVEFHHAQVRRPTAVISLQVFRIHLDRFRGVLHCRPIVL